MSFKIIATASMQGNKKIFNKEFETFLDTSDEWIRKRTGILSRNFATEYSIGDMALKIADRLPTENISPSLILVATFSSREPVPSIAARVQKHLKADNKVLCADVNIGCAGFLGIMLMAERYLRDGEYGILIASEKVSDYLDMSDRNTAVLFGDGAGAALIQKRDRGLFEGEMYTFGNDEDLRLNEDGKVSMEGQNVYRFANSKAPESIERMMKKAGVGPEEIDHVICHQANIRILQQISRQTKIDFKKFHSNLSRCGNTSAASVPLLLDSVMSRIKPGEKVIFSAFGAGLCAGSIIMEW